MSPLWRIAALEQEFEVGAGHVSGNYCNKPFEFDSGKAGMNS
jgi:hypothetical protein